MSPRRTLTLNSIFTNLKSEEEKEKNNNIQPEEQKSGIGNSNIPITPILDILSEYSVYSALSPTNIESTPEIANGSKVKSRKLPNIRVIIKKALSLLNSDSLLQKVAISLVSGGLVVVISILFASKRWQSTNHLDRLTQYKTTILHLVVFSKNTQETRQLLKNREKIGALRALTSDALLKLDHKNKQDLVVFLQGVNLLGIRQQKDLPGMLSEVNLTGAKLKKLKLNDVDLSFSDLSKATLNDTELRNSLLNGTTMKEVGLMNADLRDADLSFSLTLHKEINKSCIDKLTEWGVIRESFASNTSEQPIVSLIGSNLIDSNSTFSFSTIPKNCSIRRTDLRDADLRDADLKGADLKGANLIDADLRGANLIDADLRGAIYDDKTQFSNKQNVDQDLKKKYMKEALFLQERGAKLEGVNLNLAELKDVILIGANLSDANLKGADLSGANLSDANLKDADLSGANLSGANLSDANLKGADLSGANLRGAEVSDEILKQEEMILCNTTWKDGFIQNPQDNCNENEIERLYYTYRDIHNR